MQNFVPKLEFQVRPYAHKFLKELSNFFELVIFTAADQLVSLNYDA